MIEKLTRWISEHILLVPLMMLLVLLVGCKSTQFVPVETIKTDSVYLKMFEHDSIFVRDSVYVKDKGDTVYQYKYKYIFKNKAVHDTLYVEHVDSIAVPYPIERELSRWEQLKMDIGGYAIVTGVVILILIGGSFIYRLRK